MTNTISSYFTDEDLEQSLRMHFDEEEQDDMDFRTIFNQIEDNGEYLELRFRNKRFYIDKITGGVTTSEGDEE